MAPAELFVEFDICMPQSFTDEAINRLASECAQLQYLDLEGCYKLTGATLESIGRKCRSLRSLNISGCDLLDDAPIAQLVSSQSARESRDG